MKNTTPIEDPESYVSAEHFKLPEAVLIYINIQPHQPVSRGQLFYDLSARFHPDELKDVYSFLLENEYIRESQSKKGFIYVTYTKTGKVHWQLPPQEWEPQSDEEPAKPAKKPKKSAKQPEPAQIPEDHPEQDRESDFSSCIVPDGDDLDLIADANTRMRQYRLIPIKSLKGN